MISQKSVQEIINTAQIEDIVGDFVSLKRRGANLLGLCPFHNEKTPSFNVNPSRNIYKCFGCGEGGDPINFLMAQEQLTFPEALKYIAKKYGIEIEETETSEEAQQEKQFVDSLYIITEYAKNFYQKQLFETDAGKSVGLSYFKSRGFREETIKKWGLGFTPPNKGDFTKRAVADGFNIELLRSLGLTNKYDTDFFRDRVMFTIRNLSGKIIAYAGRTLSKDKKVPKYINSPETEIYVKNKALFGISFAKKMIRKEDECILVEGYTDVISLNQSGIENVVASSGTSLTVGQIDLIKRYTPNMKILYDGDAAGIKAALRGIDLILEQDMNVKVVLLPDGEDPDSYLQKVGTADFKKFITEKAEDFIFFKTNLLLGEVGNDPIKKTGLIKDIVESIARIPDTIKRSVYTKECARVMEIDEGILVMETNKMYRVLLQKRQKEAEREERRRQNLRQRPSNPLSGTGVQAPPFAGNFPNTEFPPSEGHFPPEHYMPPVMPGMPDVMPHFDAASESRQKTEVFYEKDVARVLVCSGGKIFDEETKITVAQYIVNEIRDVIDNFDHPLYERIARETIAMVDAKKAINDDTFVKHIDQEIKNFTISCLAPSYGEYSPGWKEKGVILNSQKVIELNFTPDSINGLLMFKLRKVIKMSATNQQRLKELKPDEVEKMMTILKVQSKLNEMRDELAERTKTVVFGVKK